MLIAARDLVRRWRVPQSRGRMEEIRLLRSRLAAAARERASDEEVAIARELRELRVETAEAFEGAASCGGCATGRPLPHGRYRGGFCCGGRTDGVFDEDEVAALALGGTRAGSLAVPTEAQAGCAFRGPESCSLDARDRPALCLRFVCRELEGQLRARGDWARVRASTRKLESAFERFRLARAARHAAEEERAVTEACGTTARGPLSEP